MLIERVQEGFRLMDTGSTLNPVELLDFKDKENNPSGTHEEKPSQQRGERKINLTS